MGAKGKFKPWHIAVLALAVAAAGVSAYIMLSGRDTVRIRNRITMVDVTTGDLYNLPVPVGIPNLNPDTGQLTLLPVRKDDQGRWVVSSRDLSALPAGQAAPRALVDRGSGEVRVTGEAPKRVR